MISIIAKNRHMALSKIEMLEKLISALNKKILCFLRRIPKPDVLELQPGNMYRIHDIQKLIRTEFFIYYHRDKYRLTFNMRFDGSIHVDCWYYMKGSPEVEDTFESSDLDAVADWLNKMNSQRSLDMGIDVVSMMLDMFRSYEIATCELKNELIHFIKKKLKIPYVVFDFETFHKGNPNAHGPKIVILSSEMSFINMNIILNIIYDLEKKGLSQYTWDVSGIGNEHKNLLFQQLKDDGYDATYHAFESPRGEYKELSYLINNFITS